MRLALIGPGDIKYHYNEILRIPKEKLESELEEIAQSLVNSKVEIEILPDKGVSLEIARLYKAKGGKKVLGAVPKSDKIFGISHLQPYIEEKVNGEPLFDQIINSGDWFKHDLIKGLLGDAILYLGSSPGTDGERHYAVYLYKLMQKFKQGIDVSGKNIHQEIRAGKNFKIFAYKPFIKSRKLPDEDEIYMKKFNINLIYLNNPKELEKNLKIN